MSESAPDDVITWENLIYVADFLKASNERRFPVLGGEPTLHPEFVDMIIYLLERNFDINVFTSGIMSNEKLEDAAMAFRDVPPERLSFTCNLNDPAKTRTPLAEQECVKRFLGTFGRRVTAGFNIYRLDFDLEFIFQYVTEYGLNKVMRIGIAHPIPGKKNRFVKIEDMDKIYDRLMSFTPYFERLRIKPGLDCGFPLCELDDSRLGWLYRFTGGKYDFGCAPVIDIGPDLKVWSCFPLSSFHAKSLFEFNSLKEVHDYYNRLHENIRTEVGGIYEECDSCSFREEALCRGGCLAHSLNHFQKEYPLRMKEIYQ
jgi:radical SAM protein with 4Fe4S-binding SPASM domain